MSGSPQPRIYLSAGEPSGDAHAAAVAEALLRRLPGATLEAFGGPRLEAAGATVLDRMESYSVVGFVEAIEKLPQHWALLRRTRAAFNAGRYALAIFVDYPGYHLRAVAAAAAAGVPVLYYIAPQLWAWGGWRVKRLAVVNRLAVILPFEEPFFQQRHVATTFVGHPLKDRPPLPDRPAARRALGLDPARTTLAIFPGSRSQEVHRLWPVLRETARRVAAARPDVQFVTAATPVGSYPDPGPVAIATGDPRLVFAAADAGLCKSGTTTLEAALADVPMVITYRLHPLSHFLAQRLVQIKWAGLVNLVAGEEICPELLQSHATPDKLTTAILPLLDPQHPATRRQHEQLALVREKLGPPGAADRVADLALSLLR